MLRQDLESAGQERRSQAGQPDRSVTSMGLRLSYCSLPVHDYDLALVFYRDVLGFEVHGDVRFEGMRWVSVGPPSQPGVQIVLEPPGADPGATPGDREAIADLMAKGLL